MDFQRAVTENAEGKKARNNSWRNSPRSQKEFDNKQKSLADAQTKLQTQAKGIERYGEGRFGEDDRPLNTELQRMNDDAQKELGELQQTACSDRSRRKLKRLSRRIRTENGYAVVFDIRARRTASSIGHDVADITTEIIRRIDADAAESACRASGGCTETQPRLPAPAAEASRHPTAT